MKYSKPYWVFAEWYTLYRVLNGVIGKTVFIISMALPVSLLINVGISIERFPKILMGAIILSICFVLQSFFVPNIITRFACADDYAEWMLGKYKQGAINIDDEFSFYDILLRNCPKFLASDFDIIKKYLPINEGISILGEEVLVYKLSRTMYLMKNKSKYPLRAILTVFCALGFLLLYSSLLTAIFTVLSTQS